MKQKELIQIVAVQVLKTLSDMLANVILIGKKSKLLYCSGRTNIVFDGRSVKPWKFVLTLIKVTNVTRNPTFLYLLCFW